VKHWTNICTKGLSLYSMPYHQCHQALLPANKAVPITGVFERLQSLSSHQEQQDPILLGGGGGSASQGLWVANMYGTTKPSSLGPDFNRSTGTLFKSGWQHVSSLWCYCLAVSGGILLHFSGSCWVVQTANQHGDSGADCEVQRPPKHHRCL